MVVSAASCTMHAMVDVKMNPLARLVGWIGARTIYALIWLFGRKRQASAVPWLKGPLGSDRIGDLPYVEAAAAENLSIERNASEGGLIPDFSALQSATFDPAKVHPLVADFYQRTAHYTMDVWSKQHFPLSIGMWLLVTTISRQVNQLNFPLSPLATAHGISSEIIMFRDQAGKIPYTGWFRTLGQQTVLYTGFYMVGHSPTENAAVVKVVFPMPNGNATVLLRPSNDGDALQLVSSGKTFGDPGFYRVQKSGAGLRVWRVRSLKEYFRLYVDDGTLRCDHRVTFWGLPVLTLHYKMHRKPESADANQH
jgi:hypothetical protein